MYKRPLQTAALITLCILTLNGCTTKPDASTTASSPRPMPYPYTSTFFRPSPSPDTATSASVEAKGIYITSNIAGIPDYLNPRLQLVDDTVLNAVVIDIKADQGYVTCKNKVPMADELGITMNNIPDLDALLADLRARDIYTIARFVVFKDDTIIEQRPEYAIHVTNGANGGIYRQKEWNGAYGSAWLNPYNKDVWKYTVDMALQVAELGFDEIQFDYVRFPTDATTQYADYGDTGGLTKIEAITAFSQYAYDRLSPTGIKLSADIFGTVIDSPVDAELIGQDLAQLAQIYDVLCPMVYPSHYADGSMGIEHPDLAPYDTIRKSMEIAQDKLSALPEGTHIAILRPWLQDFTANWIESYQEYGALQLGQQIQACQDTGLTEWLIWNPRNNYSAEALAPATSTTISPTP